MIHPGQPAPDFSLYDTTRNKVTLSGLKGKHVLLLFFPQAFTSVCTAELCSVRDNMAVYDSLQATVLGISVDSVFTLAKFREEQGFTFSLLSDFNRKASSAYDVLYDTWILDMKGVSKRAAFLVDKEGIVRYAEVLDNAQDVPDFAAIRETLAGLD